MLDNRYALLFIRGELPVMDEKFDILRHPNVRGTADGKGEPFRHSVVTGSVASVVIDEEIDPGCMGEQDAQRPTSPADLPELKITQAKSATDGEYVLLSEEDLEELFK